MSLSSFTVRVFAYLFGTPTEARDDVAFHVKRIRGVGPSIGADDGRTRGHCYLEVGDD